MAHKDGVMMNKIGLEEHFALEETLGDSQNFVGPETWRDLRARLLDVQDMRLREMDANGIDVMILSLNSPAVQAVTDARAAADVARRANDLLAAEISRKPQRFKGLAALPMQDPHLASLELERCVRDLGFCGALINGYSQVSAPSNAVYYDIKPYWDFWEVVERLDVPFYLHPRVKI
jgi:predicted TIM-barrel fold metal-dependent hydrolase